MNFGRLSKLKESAEVLASAAKNFKGLDDMAANDDYIHSDSFNVRGSASKQKNGSSGDHQNGGLGGLNNEHENGATTWSLIDRRGGDASAVPSTAASPRPESPGMNTRPESPGMNNSTHSLPLQTPPKAPPQRQSTVPILPIVADALSSSERQKARHEVEQKSPARSVHDDEGSSSSSSGLSEHIEHGFSDDEDDPILSMMRKDGAKPGRVAKKKSKGRTSRRLNLEDDEARNRQDRNKNKHRFMQELDDRISKPESDIEMAPLVPQSPEPEQPRPQAWLWGLVNTRRQTNEPAEASPKVTPALSRQKPQSQEIPEEENFSVVVSSSVLGEDELRELDLLRKSSTHTPGLFGMVKQHPRESFIALTFLLGTGAYFFSRSVSAEDDVT